LRRSFMARRRADKDHVRITKDQGTTYIRVPLMLFVGLVVLILVLGFLFWSAKWRRDTHHLAVTNPGDFEALLPSIVHLSQGTLTPGNRVAVTQNGDGFFPPLFQDIAKARNHIHIESYIWWDGKVARELAALLARKAREGVEVRVLVDGSGGRQISKVEELLTGAGVEVVRFHPPRFSNLARMNNRDHRKIMIVDGRVAYVGGYGIADEWTGKAQGKDHWRDTGLRIEGPLINQLQGAFCENWIEETGKVIAGERYFPAQTNVGGTTTHVAYTSPSGSVSSVQVLYYLAFKAARREIVVQNPYLLPERDAIKAMEEAVKRGVKVWIMVPSTGATDAPMVQHASHHRFGNLLKRGIRIWEYDRTLLHQKVIVVDGIWSSVGSTNFDARSFELNDEITVGVVDAAIAAQLRQAFVDDLRYAQERKFEEWRNRSLWHKLKDGLAYLAHEQL
jgi:cardiolipin synthase